MASRPGLPTQKRVDRRRARQGRRRSRARRRSAAAIWPAPPGRMQPTRATPRASTRNAVRQPTVHIGVHGRGEAGPTSAAIWPPSQRLRTAVPSAKQPAVAGISATEKLDDRRQLLGGRRVGTGATRLRARLRAPATVCVDRASPDRSRAGRRRATMPTAAASAPAQPAPCRAETTRRAVRRRVDADATGPQGEPPRRPARRTRADAAGRPADANAAAMMAAARRRCRAESVPQPRPAIATGRREKAGKAATRAACR